MIQATDFVCPVCRAQVGKDCTNKGVFFRLNPHPERLKLARDKRQVKRSKP